MSSQGSGRVAITGASGFIGAALTDSFTRDGWEVLRLVRRKAGPGEVEWRPQESWIDRPALEGIDAFVHLAGENIFGIWTPAKKRRILESRSRGTRLIAEALASLEKPPGILVSASGVDYYGDTGEAVVHEDRPPGDDFLARVSVAWEAGATSAAAAGIRVVHPRFGIVLGRRGGALRLMMPAFRLGLGARLGSGRQWTSWISLRDAVRVVRFAISEDRLRGPVNAVAPEPLRNEEFTKELGRAARRPTFLVVPERILRWVPGGMGKELLLSSHRAIPTALNELEFGFEHPTVRAALAGGLDGSG